MRVSATGDHGAGREMRLTNKQARFVEEYMVDLNATQAAIRAGYSKKTAEWIGPQLLGKTHVADAVQAKRAEVSERTGRTVADVMRDIGRVRDDAMREVFDPETGKGSMLSHKDALKALELEGKHLGAFADRVQVSNPDGSPLKPTVIKIVAAKK